MCSSYESGVVEIANLFKVLLLGVCRLRLAAFVRILSLNFACLAELVIYLKLRITILWEVLLQRWLANEDMFLLSDSYLFGRLFCSKRPFF